MRKMPVRRESPAPIKLKDDVDNCYKLILEFLGSHGRTQNQIRKCKYLSLPSSPSGIFDAPLSYDSSGDS